MLELFTHLKQAQQSVLVLIRVHVRIMKLPNPL